MVQWLMAKIIRKVKNHLTELEREILKQMLVLATSGFGLVAALAWNEVIKELVTEVIKPVLGENSGIFSLIIYAAIVTILAVIITFYLTRLIKKN